MSEKLADIGEPGVEALIGLFDCWQKVLKLVTEGSCSGVIPHLALIIVGLITRC